MPHASNKQCLDHSIVVDTSSAATSGRRASAAWRGMMNGWPRRWPACIVWPSPF